MGGSELRARRVVRLAAGMSTVVLVASCSSLRGLADQRDIALGTAVDNQALAQEDDYRQVLANEFNLVVPENVMKWDTTEPVRGQFNFAPGDELVGFAEAHDMAVKGTALAWWFQNPPWLETGQFSRDEAIDILRNHIHTLVGHYRGRVAEWDVVNEPLDLGGDDYRDNPWLRAIGPDYIDLAFQFAHEADPDAELFLNDFDGPLPGPKSQRLVDMAIDLKDRGVPITGLGMQFHVFPGITSIDFDAIAEDMRQLDDAGLEYAITEWDMGLPLPASPADLEHQAELAGGLMTTCLQAPNCDTFVVWGFTDRHSWIPGAIPGYGAATISDEQLDPKPAWTAILEALRAEG